MDLQIRNRFSKSEVSKNFNTMKWEPTNKEKEATMTSDIFITEKW